MFSPYLPHASSTGESLCFLALGVAHGLVFYDTPSVNSVLFCVDTGGVGLYTGASGAHTRPL